MSGPARTAFASKAGRAYPTDDKAVTCCRSPNPDRSVAVEVARRIPLRSRHVDPEPADCEVQPYSGCAAAVANLCETEHACHPHQVRNALERVEIQLRGESGSKPIGKPIAVNFAAAVVTCCLHVEALRTGQRLHAQSDYSLMQLQGAPGVGTPAYRPVGLHVPIFDGDMT